MNKIVRECISVLYPKRCPVCGEIIPIGRGSVCKDCYKELPFIEGPRCMCCSKEIASWEEEYCYDCSKKDFSFESGIALWSYSHKMKRSMAYFKYHNRKEYGYYYGEEFVRNFGDVIQELQPDALIPVPIHWTRHISRGYNQATILAKEIGKRMQIPVIEDFLIRNKKTEAQKHLNNKERARNLYKAFSISKKWEKKVAELKRIVIVDDIYTTGSTVNACAKVLKQHGIQEVYFFVLCIGSGY